MATFIHINGDNDIFFMVWIKIIEKNTKWLIWNMIMMQHTQTQKDKDMVKVNDKTTTGYGQINQWLNETNKQNRNRKNGCENGEMM